MVECKKSISKHNDGEKYPENTSQGEAVQTESRFEVATGEVHPGVVRRKEALPPVGWNGVSTVTGKRVSNGIARSVSDECPDNSGKMGGTAESFVH